LDSLLYPLDFFSFRSDFTIYEISIFTVH